MLTFVISCVDKTLNIKILLPKLRKKEGFITDIGSIQNQLQSGKAVRRANQSVN